jgi:glucan biosynthesis protein C
MRPWADPDDEGLSLSINPNLKKTIDVLLRHNLLENIGSFEHWRTAMSGTGSASARRNDLDWVRILAVLLLIPFHTARIFDTHEAFYVKNSVLSPGLTYVVIVFLNRWHMPLLFLVAGASTYYALRKRTGGQYIGERLIRLMIPFVFGTLVIVPPQMYFALLHRSSTTASYLGYYPTFFQVRPPGMPDYTGVGFTWGHLWFILNLFVISLAALPLFLSLRTKRGWEATAKIAGFLEKGPAILLPAILFPFVRLLPEIDGKPFFMYLMVFVFGFMLMSDIRYQRALERNRWAALILGLACTAVGYVILLSGAAYEDFSPGCILIGLVESFSIWFWLIAILAFGQRYLNIDNRLLRYARGGAYPFYVLHQTVIVVIGYYVVQWNAGVAPKFLVIAFGSLTGTIALYDLVVRRTRVTKFLFGMKSKAVRTHLK